MSSYGQGTNRPYQGYPYRDPAVTDAPTLTPAEVAARAKWQDLPVKKLGSKAIDDQPMVFIDLPGETNDEQYYPSLPSTQTTPTRPAPQPSPAKKGSIDDIPQVFIDIPESCGSDVSSRQDGTEYSQHQQTPSRLQPIPSRPAPSQPEHSQAEPSPAKNGSTEDIPMVYIDIPESNGSDVCRRQNDMEYSQHQQPQSPSRPPQSIPSRPAPREPGPSSSRPRPPAKRHSIDDTPMVYIDIPESSGSDVCQSRVQEEEVEPAYVQETIFYDPFKDRRIDQPEEEDSSDLDSVNSEPCGSRRPAPPRPLPPSSLNLNSPGSSGYSTNTPSHSNVPSFMSKESYVYGRQPTPDDGFPLSPIPVNEFPAPPPAYEEIDSTPRPIQTQPVRQEAQTAPPPVQVITTPSPSYPGVVGLPNPNRKFLHCHHCGSTVHTLVIRETGVLTHFFAWFFMLVCLFPITAAIYCTSCCKYKNHYCPNCNKKIGYEIPCFCMDMTYVND